MNREKKNFIYPNRMEMGMLFCLKLILTQDEKHLNKLSSNSCRRVMKRTGG